MDERFSRIESVERSHRMTLACYKITNNFPKQELFGLASQIRRCSSSILANIAEGCGRMGIASSIAFSRWHADPRTNLSIISCWQETLAIWEMGYTNLLKANCWT